MSSSSYNVYCTSIMNSNIGNTVTRSQSEGATTRVSCKDMSIVLGNFSTAAFRTTLVAAIIILGLISHASAQTVPPLINYQGRLTGADGVGIEGTRKLEFRIWSDVVSTVSNKMVWGPQTFAAVPLVGGHFNVILGMTDTHGKSIADAFGGESRYLETTVYDATGQNPAAIAPRQQILSAPYALMADGVKADGISSTMIAEGAVNSRAVVDGSIDAADMNVILSGVGATYGNGKDGSGAASDALYGPAGGPHTMGGEYWFDEFDIDADITVDSTVGWLVIRANTLRVSKAGGAIIDGKGKSRSQGSAGTARFQSNTYMLMTSSPSFDTFPYFGCAAQGGSGGSGEAYSYYGGGSSPTDFRRNTGKSGDVLFSMSTPSGIKNILGATGVTGGTAMAEYPGNPGISADRLSIADWPLLLKNVINYGSGGSGGTGGSTWDSAPGDASNGGDGGAGGAGIALFSKTLILDSSLACNCSGMNGVTVTGGTVGAGGSGGGGGSGSSIIAYITKTGTGTITQICQKGLGGAGYQGGGAGGNGGDGIYLLIDDSAKTIDINGTGMKP